MGSLKFFLQAVLRPREVGAIVPSSKSLVTAMLSPIDFERAKTVVEFGPGTGAMTREILKRMRPDARLITFEVNDSFCRDLAVISDDRLTVLKESAEKIDVKTEAIISSLPMLAFPVYKKRAILSKAAKNLASSGLFVQFQYTNELEPLLGEYFARIKRSWVPLNVPPAFVYACRNE